jgi:hypothetical protein
VDLIDWLNDQRGERTHDEFARFLGISPSWWSRLVNRERQINDADLGRVLRVYPEYCSEILALYKDQAA